MVIEMKKLLPLLLLLLLSGCAESTATTPSPAEPSAAIPSSVATPTPVPVPTTAVEGLWWEALTREDLPEEVEPIGNISSVDGPVCLGLLEEEDIGLYGDGDPQNGVLLRKGEVLQFFPQIYATARYTLPELDWLDWDGDGEKELVVKYLVKDTDGDIIYEFHVYRWDGTAWTDHPFSVARYRDLLSDILRYRYADGLVKLVAGGSAISARVPDGAAPTGLAPIGDLVFFRKEGGSYTVIFGLRLLLPGGEEQDVATLTASLIYDGTDFSLQNYVLESVGGV